MDEEKELKKGNTCKSCHSPPEVRLRDLYARALPDRRGYPPLLLRREAMNNELRNLRKKLVKKECKDKDGEKNK